MISTKQDADLIRISFSKTG